MTSFAGCKERQDVKKEIKPYFKCEIYMPFMDWHVYYIVLVRYGFFLNFMPDDHLVIVSDGIDRM
jgi:hypothetical protein